MAAVGLSSAETRRAHLRWRLESALAAGAAQDAEYPARVVAIGADRDAEGLVHAEEFGIPSFAVSFANYPDREAWGDALLEQVQQWQPDLVILSGLMRLLPPRVVAALSPNLINTHPAYLPEFPGAHGVRDAIAAGVSESGASVIVVDNGVDSGPILSQRRLRCCRMTPSRLCTTASSSSSGSCWCRSCSTSPMEPST